MLLKHKFGYIYSRLNTAPFTDVRLAGEVVTPFQPGSRRRTIRPTRSCGARMTLRITDQGIVWREPPGVSRDSVHTARHRIGGVVGDRVDRVIAELGILAAEHLTNQAGQLCSV